MLKAFSKFRQVKIGTAATISVKYRAVEEWKAWEKSVKESNQSFQFPRTDV